MGKKKPAVSSSKQAKSTPDVEPELTPKQLKEKRREEARLRAAETRKLVSAGANAWTGKLPAALLAEHCQKQKWEKVDYSIRGTDENFKAIVTLSKRNPKTKELEKVRFDPPEWMPTQKTPVEARHFAATYSMHRMMSHANLKFLFPPLHQDLWSELDKDKANSPAHMSWKWNRDPFQAAIDLKASKVKKAEASERRNAAMQANDLRQAIASTKLEEQSSSEKLATSQKTKSPSVSAPSRENSTGAGEECIKPGNGSGDSRTSSPEAQAPAKRIHYNATLLMTKKMRTNVEKVIRGFRGFQFSQSDGLSRQSGSALYKQIETTLIKLGFDKHQSKEALEYSHTLSSALIWLLVHVPEDDLPASFLPTAAHGVTARVTSNLLVENATAKIRTYGFSEDLAHATVLACNGSISKAMVTLTSQLADLNSPENAETDEGMWEEECESLRVVRDPGTVSIEAETCTIKLAKSNLSITYYKPLEGYPNAVPGIGLAQLQSTGKSRPIPKYILLDVTRRAAQFCSKELLGTYMLNDLAEYIEETLEKVKNRPSPLSSISSGVSGTSERNELAGDLIATEVKSRSKQMRQSKPRHLDNSLLQSQLKEHHESAEGVKMQSFRQKLPAWQKQTEVVSLLDAHQVLLVTGETGSGKSTQIVQFILDTMISRGNGNEVSILCTQPRRISAMGLAQRVADERCRKLGDEVGYVIRGENKTSSSTQIRFMTAGVLLRMIQSDSDNCLNAYSHIVVDEVHERSLDSDFLLIMLRRILSRNKKLKIVLMSATVDPKQFRSYFSKVSGEVGYTHITGRTFPVQTLWLNDILETTRYVPANSDAKPGEVGKIITHMRDSLDYDLIRSIVEYIHGELQSSDGSILIFMSGAAEIDRAIRAINKFSSKSPFWVLPLHASLPPSEQRKVFNAPPRGMRKIVVSTNVAETSITIPDVVAVIDSGRVKETVYDANANVTRLVDNWTSVASATQRMGRAGRVRAGTCYKLYTEQLQQSKMPTRPLPEMLRAPLESLYLSVKAMGIGDVDRFLQNALDPPNTEAMSTARKSLVEYGALDASNGDQHSSLTPLGMHMSLIPADPRTAKLLVLGAMLGCIGGCLTAASIISLGKPPFRSTPENSAAAKEHHKATFGADGSGDLIAAIRAYELFIETPASRRRKWCDDNFVGYQACTDLISTRKQLLGSLVIAGLIAPESESTLSNSQRIEDESVPLLRAVIGASLRPQITQIVMPQTQYKNTVTGSLEVDPEAKQIKYYTPTSNRVFVHPRSLLFGAVKFTNDARFLSYASAIVSSKHFISDITPLSSYGMALFSSRIEIDPLGQGIVIDEWSGLRCWSRTGVLIHFLQKLFGELLAVKFSNPRLDISQHAVVSAVQELIETDGRGWES